MSVMNLNRVLKTVSAGSVKLAAPADRIGSGVNVGIAPYSSTILSQGHFPTPRLPEPEPRSRRTVADEQSMPPLGPPVVPNGSVSGKPASRRRVLKTVTAPLARPSTVAAMTATTEMLWQAVDTSRASHPGFQRHLSRIGSDCQSPDRQDAGTDLTITPRKRTWCRTVSPMSTARK